MNAGRWVIAAAAVGGVAAVIVFGGQAHADPIEPGCLDASQYAWYNPCSGQAPWNSSNWDGTDDIPGTYGPHGYTPVTEQPIPGLCTDYRAACPSS